MDLSLDRKAGTRSADENQSPGSYDLVALSRAGNQRDGGDPLSQALSTFAKQPDHTRLLPGQVLWDIGTKSLTARAALTGEPTTRDDIYREINRIMVQSGFADAHLEGNRNISDADLPRSWNSITNHTPLIIYTPESRQHFEQLIRQHLGASPPADQPPGGQPPERPQPSRPQPEPSEPQPRPLEPLPKDPLQYVPGPPAIPHRAPPDAYPTPPGHDDWYDKGGGPQQPTRLPEGQQPTQPPDGPQQSPPPVKFPGMPDSPQPPAGPGTPGKPDAPQPPNGPGTPGKPDAPQPPAGPGTPGTPGQPGDKPGTPGQPNGPGSGGDQPVDLMTIVKFLRRQHDHEQQEFQQDVHSQGFIGKAFDSVKNTFGTSGENKPWYSPSSLWSQLLNADDGSDSMQRKLDTEAKQLDALEQAARANDLKSFSNSYRDLTGKDFDPKISLAGVLKNNELDQRYERAQSGGVESITDTAAALAAIASTRIPGAGGAGARSMAITFGSAFALGAGTKTGPKLLDGKYADPANDAITGGFMGLTVPVSELAGAGMSRYIGKKRGLRVTDGLFAARIETQGTGIGTRLLSAAAKGGTAGAVFGGLESPSRTAIQEVRQGHSLDGVLLAECALSGAGLGFLGDTFLNFGLDAAADGFRRWRPSPVDMPPPTEVNGVQVPESGSVAVEDAARMLNQDPAEFLKKAADDPYGAVTDAADLYEKTGVNIRNYDPATGALNVPAEYADALNKVQRVDGLTADSPLSVQQKVPFVRSADEFVTNNQAQIDEAFDRISKDKNFQKVLQLTEQERGADAARQLQQQFRDGLNRDVTVDMSVQRIQTPDVTEQVAFDQAKAKAESFYLQKAADFFHDMTDPGQRARLNDLVDDIFAKFTPQTITVNDLQGILNSFSAEERPLAEAILQRSAVNASDVGLKMRLQAIRSELSHVTGSGIPHNVYTLAPDSSGNMIGYLFRKSNSSPMSMQNLDALVQRVNSGDIPGQVVLFDDLASMQLTEAQRAALAKVPKVYAVDLGAFEKGINVLDVAAGPEAVRAKLARLVTEAKQASDATPGLLPTTAAKAVLDDAFDQQAQWLGSHVQVVRPTGSWHFPNVPSAAELASMPPEEAIYRQIVVPKASKEEIANFLSKYAGEDREIAARMLSEGAVHNSFSVLLQKSQQVNRAIASILQSTGAKPEDLLLVVDKDPGGSTHLVSYLYGRANGLRPSNFVSARQLNDLITSGSARGKIVCYFDDTIYSGLQTSGMLESNVSSFMPFKKVIIGSYGAYDKGLTAIGNTHLAKIGLATVVTVDHYQPFYSTGNPFFSSLTVPLRGRVQSIGGYGGFGDVQGYQLWSYMYPDNNIQFFNDFGSRILKLPGS